MKEKFYKSPNEAIAVESLICCNYFYQFLGNKYQSKLLEAIDAR
jgi:hypothetical protein